MVKPGEFAEFLESESERWSELVGHTLEHTEFGEGKVVDVNVRKDYIPLVCVRFIATGHVRTFNTDIFRHGQIVRLEVPEKLQEAFGAFEEGRRTFEALAEKYHVSIDKLMARDGPSELVSLLVKVDDREELNSEEIDLLEEQGLYNVVATYYFRKFKASENLWDLVKACSELRQANLADKAIKASDACVDEVSEDARAKGALWTTRGGAFRDLGELSQAKFCGERAVEICPQSYYPYNLLGAIFYEEGEMAKGDQYFDQAIGLGSNERLRDKEVKATIQRSSAEKRNAIIEYLLSKDPKRYRWARAFFEKV